MNNVPSGLLRRMREFVLRETRPACLLLDKCKRAHACIGDLSYYGFPKFNPGEDCTEQLPFLVGIDVDDSLEWRFLETPNGRSAHVHLIPDREFLMVGFLDATEQKVNQKQMQQKANELHLLHDEQTKLMRIMESLQQELDKKRIEAERANRLKDLFIASMSHEFRTPLTSILGYTTLLKGDLQDDSDQLENLTAVERGAKHLLSLVENLLDHAQIEASSLVIQKAPTDLHALLEEIKQAFAPLAADRKLDFKVKKTALPSRIEIDELRLRQIIVNLTANAIKFTDKGWVELRAGWQNDELSLDVVDTGPGIAEQDKERIFEAFEQLENKPGSGLGLSIAQHLVKKMNGDLSLNSRPGEGSRFQVRLPAVRVDAPLSSDTRDSNPDSITNFELASSPTVLIVEDDPDIMRLLYNVFVDAGSTVVVAGNGLDAVEKALTESPDLVLMDLNLPQLDGFQATRKLRVAGFEKPIFALSASILSDDKKKAMDAGCDDYLIKPINFSHLFNIAGDYLKGPIASKSTLPRLTEIYSQFNASLPEKLSDLDDIWKSTLAENWDPTCREKLRYFVHRLAGSSGLYGHQTISRVSRELDRMLAEGGEPIDIEDNRARQQITIKISDLRKHLESAISGNEFNGKTGKQVNR